MSRTGESSPDETLTKQERAYRTIRERILSGEYGPGHRVVIGSLATELGVSALPVREAIRRLEAEGLVVFRPNAGAHVAPADPFVFEEEMTVLAVLEGYATGLAAPFVGDEDVVRLEAITDAMEAAVERLDTLGLGRLNQDFHEVQARDAAPGRRALPLRAAQGHRHAGVRLAAVLRARHADATGRRSSRTIISFDCGYGIGQVTSGMHAGETPAFDRARVAARSRPTTWPPAPGSSPASGAPRTAWATTSRASSRTGTPRPGRTTGSPTSTTRTTPTTRRTAACAIRRSAAVVPVSGESASAGWSTRRRGALGGAAVAYPNPATSAATGAPARPARAEVRHADRLREDARDPHLRVPRRHLH